MAVTRERLDAMVCDDPDCLGGPDEGLYFHARCHPDARTWARYTHGELRVECAECEAEVVTILIPQTGGA